MKEELVNFSRYFSNFVQYKQFMIFTEKFHKILTHMQAVRN